MLGNHDQHRIASRVGPPQARVAAMLLLTLRGTPTLYYGDEIGMEDVTIPTDRIQDPAEKNEPGLGLGRDPERTPMQWDDSLHGGFSTGGPWLPLAEDFRTSNVKALAENPTSILALYKRLIALRRERLALSVGHYAPVMCKGNVQAYERRHGAERLLVALNMGHETESVTLQAGEGTILLFSTLIVPAGCFGAVPGAAGPKGVSRGLARSHWGQSAFAREWGKKSRRGARFRSEVRHRSDRAHMLRRHDPAHHVLVRIRQHAGDVPAARDAGERRSDLPRRARHAWNHVARRAGVLVHRVFAFLWMHGGLDQPVHRRRVLIGGRYIVDARPDEEAGGNEDDRGHAQHCDCNLCRASHRRVFI